MPGLLERSIDRELGLDDSDSARGGKDSWRRDWPLLVGLILSAALIAASTTIGGSHGHRPASAASDAAAAVSGAMPGEVVDVGQAAPAHKPSAAPKKARKAKRSSATPAAREPARAGAAASAPASEPSSTSRPSSGAQSQAPRQHASTSSNSGGGRTGAGSGAPQAGRVVNVTGTSAAFANGSLSYAFTAPTHTPTVGKSWRLSIAVKRAGAPIAGTVKVDIVHNGSVVGHAASGKLESGRFTHDFDWPERSVGYPLTVKTSVVGGGFQQSFLFNVKVQSAG